MRQRAIRQWDSPEEFVQFIRYGYLLKDKPMATVRPVVRDANGNEVAFPMSVSLEFIFKQ